MLRNMLPEPIAGWLKQREEVIADAFGEVTVLFADIVDFTEHAQRTTPAATVALLNDLFSQFDGLTEARGLEKIKTVGDAHMVAGVIGRRRFSYDLWGDTVNTASRLRTTGVPGCIQVTERTRNLLGDRYLFQERGMIQVKGKGKLLTYFLPERASSPARPDAGPGRALLVPHQATRPDPRRC